ncbi:MAG: carbohydrate ABC transporter permease [Pseudomonadota bacterium]|nr:carbohydrate ABC transporter permease [Pseudomonadota bacterium]
MTTRYLQRGFVYAALSIAAFISVFPFFWLMVGATNTSADILKGKTSIGGALFANFYKLIQQVDLPTLFWNSTKIAVIATALTLVVASLSGYAFEIFRSKLSDRIFAALLAMLSIPFAALMIPLFVTMAKLHLINTHTAVIIPTVASIFMIFYFRQATKSFPTELRDAARVDGLKEWQIFLYIYVPVMRSTYAAATIIIFMANWNAYLWPLIVLQTNDTKTLTLAVASLLSAYVPDYGVVMVATTLATLPTLFIFFVLQKQFVQGLLGSLK